MGNCVCARQSEGKVKGEEVILYIGAPELDNVINPSRKLQTNLYLIADPKNNTIYKQYQRPSFQSNGGRNRHFTAI